MAKKQDTALAETKSVNTVRISDEAPISAQDDIPAARRLLALMGVTEEASAAEMLEDAVVDLNRASFYAVRAGARFLAIKASLKHGEFVPAIEGMGIEVRRAQHCMQLARFVAALPESQAQALLTVPKSRLMAITRADPEVLEELVASGRIGDLASLSVRDLQKQLDKEKAKALTLETKLETAEAERDRARSHLQHKLNVLQMPEFCLVAREEAAALTEQMDIALNGLEALLNDNLLAPHGGVPEALRFKSVAAGTYYHALRAVHTRSAYLLSMVESEFNESVTGEPLFEHQLKPIEVDGFKHAREQIIGRLKTQASNREALRENSKEGKKGRKRTVRAEG